MRPLARAGAATRPSAVTVARTIATMINGYIDLRSDTVTVPTPQMREAMAAAEVGDDVYGEDPSVNKLQDMAAARLGKEAGLFVGSGTQGNLVSLLSHLGRGDEFIVGDRAHIYNSEAGGSAALAGAHAMVLRNKPDGTLDVGEITAAIRPDNEHYARTRLVCLENTHNQCHGTPLSPEYVRQVADVAHARRLMLHIDGARLFNAAVAQGVDVKALVDHADSVTFCLSKGLGAPVGSVVCGTRAFIATAHRARKIVGGAMRQAGIVAAAGIVALETMTERLAEDHANAHRLARALSAIPGISIDVDKVRSNLVFFDVGPETGIDGAELAARAERQRVRLGGSVYGSRVRAVTHCWVSQVEVDEAARVIADCLR